MDFPGAITCAWSETLATRDKPANEKKLCQTSVLWM